MVLAPRHPPLLCFENKKKVTVSPATANISSCLPSPHCFCCGGALPLPISMSASGSSSKQGYCKISPEEQSLSQESCNHADKYPASNNSKNGESSVGSHSPQPIPTKPTTPSVQDEAVPLTGNPYFTCVVSKSQIQSPFQLAIPRRFCALLPSASVTVLLSCGRRTWEMRYCGDSSLKRFDHGWSKFAIDNNLKVGDGCVFELTDTENIKFQVRILRGEIPTPAGGQSSDHPILIG